MSTVFSGYDDDGFDMPLSIPERKKPTPLSRHLQKLTNAGEVCENYNNLTVNGNNCKKICMSKQSKNNYHWEECKKKLGVPGVGVPGGKRKSKKKYRNKKNKTKRKRLYSSKKTKMY